MNITEAHQIYIDRQNRFRAAFRAAEWGSDKWNRLLTLMCYCQERLHSISYALVLLQNQNSLKVGTYIAFEA